MNTTPQNNDEDFQLLRDEPLDETQPDKFGYKAVAQAITKLILKSDPPTTIGLYGAWGVGKSSICQLVSCEVKKTEKFEIFYFDTWKYERDSLRRQFLIKLDKDLFNGTLRYQDILNQSLVIPRKLDFIQALILTIEKLFTKLVVPFCVAMFALVGLMLLNKYVWNFVPDIQIILQPVTTIALTLGIIVAVFRFIADLVDFTHGETETHRTDSAEGFEYYYNEALKQLGANKKILVIVDNLDRVEHSNAVGLLSDIKTFLATKNNDKEEHKSIFLIPCDSNAIYAQLREVYKEIDPEEFLRKFFSYSIKVPKFLNIELDDYVREKLEQAKIPSLVNEDVIHVAGRAFKNSPREIIQFTNSLVALYILATEREVKSVLESENIGFLAKVLIIRLKWHEQYSFIEEQLLRTAKTFEEIVKEIPKPKEDSKSESSQFNEFKRFHEATLGVKPSDERKIDVFFSLKKIQDDRLPEWDSFIYSSEDRDLESIEQIASKVVSDENKIKDFANILQSDYLSKNKQNTQKLRNVAVSILNSNFNQRIDLFNKFFEEVFGSVQSNFLDFVVKEVDFDKIKSNFSKFSSNVSKKLLNLLSSALNEIGRNETGAVVFDENTLDTWNKVLSYIQAFQNISSAEKSKILELKKNLLNNIDLRVIFPADDTQPNLLKLDKVKKFFLEDGEFKIESPFQLFRQLFFLLQHPILQNNPAVFPTLLDLTQEIIESLPITIRPSDDVEKTNLAQFTSQINSLYGLPQLNTPALRIKLVRIMLKLIQITDIPQKDEMIRHAGKTIQDIGIDINHIKEIGFENLSKFFNDNDNTKPYLVNRTKQRYDLYPELDVKLNEGEVSEIQNELINNDYDNFLKFTKLNGNKVAETSKHTLQENMISKLNGVTLDTTKNSLDLLSQMGVTDSNVEGLTKALVTIKDKEGEFKKLAQKFIKENSSIFSAEQKDALKDKKKEKDK